MVAPASVSEPLLALPPLSVLRARVTYRLLQDTTLPAYKGALLRGGFGYAFQRSVSPYVGTKRRRLVSAPRCAVQLPPAGTDPLRRSTSAQGSARETQPTVW